MRKTLMVNRVTSYTGRTRLAKLAPGRLVTCIARHADGTTETMLLAHSFSATQLKWFHAGSALNILHALDNVFTTDAMSPSNYSR